MKWVKNVSPLTHHWAMGISHVTCVGQAVGSFASSIAEFPAYTHLEILIFDIVEV